MGAQQTIQVVEIKNLPELLVKNQNASIPLHNPDTGKVERILVSSLVGGEAVKFPWLISTTYMIDDLAEWNNKIWKSKIDNNIANQPAENAFWTEVSASTNNGTALQPWAAGVFSIVNSSVTYANAGYLLNSSQTLPFNSTNFTTELAANIWLPLGSSSAVTSANVALTTPLAGATNQDELNIYLFNNKASRVIAALVNAVNVIDINWNSLQDFNSSNRVAVSANASITYTNATNAQFATFKVLISNLATITFPTGSISGDSRVSSRVFTPTANGNYTISIYKTSTEYEVVISTNPAI